MESVDKFSEKKKNIWISLTAYRTLFVLRLLLEEGRSLEELTQFLSENEITKKSISKDTIKITINTLENAGCEIARPSKFNGYKYVLHSHPFSLGISLEELDILMRLREGFIQEISWRKVLVLNDLFEKIISLSLSIEQKEYVTNTKALINVNEKLVEEFEKLVSLGKKVQIKYNSPKHGEEDIDIIPKKIVFENSNLYLFAYSFKYGENSLFNFSRINAINTVYLENLSMPNNSFEVEYKVFGVALSSFELTDNETIVSKNEKEITVKAKVDNEFSFIQRLLLLGADFKIVTPYSFKEKLINMIKQMRKRYENG